MGIYTGIRCKAVIKEEYRDDLELIVSKGLSWSESSIVWFKEFGESDFRADFIPHGTLCGMPKSWEENLTKEFDNQFDKNTGLWIFQCSLKNYNKTIERFFREVLEIIVDKLIHLEVFHEGEEHSISYKLEDKRILQNGIHLYQ